MSFDFSPFLSLVFWGCLVLLAHSYVFYPLLLAFLARGKTLSPDRFENDDELPEFAVLMAVYNEEAVLGETLDSIL
ncbi:MAG: hypothetical protein GXX91_11610, partial [Verrucomicrobiaceae bacterium]|nr:hypothetical protein [Verrucomicrobiaceae bacterium]